MRLLLRALVVLFALPAAAGADPTAFQAGAADPTEAFGKGEGVVWFIAAIAALTVIYVLMILGRQVHRRTEQELRETAKLLEEKS